MSTYRQSAKDYSNDIISKRYRPQPNPFETKKFVPNYQEQKQPDELDTSNETAQIRKTEKEIENDQDGHIIDQKSFTPSEITGKVMTNSKSTSSMSPSTNVTELKSLYAKVWTTVDNINIPALQFNQKSYYTPSGIAYMETLHAIETSLDSNEELRWIAPFYFSLPVRLYYTVLFHVLVYRAKDAAGKITKSEGSWLRSFNRRFKDVSLPIAGPMVPIATNISAILPDDSQFAYVYPDLPTAGTYTTKPNTEKDSTLLVTNSQHFLVPSITLVADMLRQFCKSTGKLSKDNFDEIGNYVPFNLSKGGNLGGIIFKPQTTNNPLGAQFAQILYNPAIMHPLPESQLRMSEILTFWRRSKATGIPEIRTDTEFSPNGPSDFTLLGEDLDWFEPCIDSANVQASFFDNSTNLSTIIPVGGQSVAVQSLLKFNKLDQTPTTITDWYPQIYNNAKAKFRSTTSTLSIENSFQAAYSLTCCKLNWEDQNGHKIGSKASGLKHGPYFDNSKFNYLLDHDVNVMCGLHTMVQTHFYNAKPTK